MIGSGLDGGLYADSDGTAALDLPQLDAPPEEALVPVLLDPGLAFGTGTHATTAMCLNALDGLIRGSERVVDFGVDPAFWPLPHSS